MCVFGGRSNKCTSEKHFFQCNLYKPWKSWLPAFSIISVPKFGWWLTPYLSKKNDKTCKPQPQPNLRFLVEKSPWWSPPGFLKAAIDVIWYKNLPPCKFNTQKLNKRWVDSLRFLLKLQPEIVSFRWSSRAVVFFCFTWSCVRLGKDEVPRGIKSMCPCFGVLKMALMCF